MSADAEDIVARLATVANVHFYEEQWEHGILDEAAAEITRLRSELATQQERYEALRREWAELTEALLGCVYEAGTSGLIESYIIPSKGSLFTSTIHSLRCALHTHLKETS